MKGNGGREEDSVFDSGSDSVYKLMVLGGEEISEGEIVRSEILSDGGVGKSALTLQLVLQRFERNWDPTVEDTYFKTVIMNGQTVHLDILDTSGQEQFLCAFLIHNNARLKWNTFFSAMRESNMRSREGFLLVFDVTNNRTLDVLDTEVRRLERIVEGPLALIGSLL